MVFKSFSAMCFCELHVFIVHIICELNENVNYLLGHYQCSSQENVNYLL